MGETKDTLVYMAKYFYHYFILFFARFWKFEPVLFCYFSNDKNFAKMRLAEQAERYDEMKDYMRDVEQEKIDDFVLKKQNFQSIWMNLASNF